MGGHLYIGVDGEHLLFCTLHLRSSYVFGEMDNLSLQVAQVYHIGIDNADMSHTCRSQIHGSWRS